jgi:putative thioredoxin
MLELNQPNVEENHVKDVNEETFMDDVIEASKTSPIVVDFWAPWCGPCKTLGPALEAEVKATNGKIKMVKIDIDQNQNLASQMRIQSIPAVFAFVDGQPIDGFMGAKAPSELKSFIDKLLEKVTDDDGDLSEAIAVANEMLNAKEFNDAAETFEAILGEDPESALAIASSSIGFDVTVIDRQSNKLTKSQNFDGRAYALSHASIRMLKVLGIWNYFKENAQPILDIKVSDGCR